MQEFVSVLYRDLYVHGFDTFVIHKKALQKEIYSQCNIQFVVQ